MKSLDDLGSGIERPGEPHSHVQALEDTQIQLGILALNALQALGPVGAAVTRLLESLEKLLERPDVVVSLDGV